jgi:hypothetical protein
MRDDDAVDLLRLGLPHETRYAVVRPIGRHGGPWPLFRIDDTGRPIRLGRLAALPARAFAFMPEDGAPEWTVAGAESWIFDDLPWFLESLRPAGYLGRGFLRPLAEKVGLPTDAGLWSADDVLLASFVFSVDAPGDLVLGPFANAAIAALPVPVAVPRSEYPACENAVFDGATYGSTVGGQQPKFAVYAEADGVPRHVVVKFTTPRNVADGRWRDLLVAEHLALETLAAAGLAAATSRIVDVDGHRFLEVDRFDRVGARGRRSAIALTALDAQFAGVAEGWHRAARALLKGGAIDATSARDAARAEAFGAAIANSDRHFGNLTFGYDDDGPARLRPIYDMLPMAFAPGAEGPRPYAPPRIDYAADLDPAAVAWAKPRARAYWRRVASEPRVSAEFRATAAATADLPALGGG